MISQTTEYALRAVVFLADHGGDLLATAKIAEGTKVSSFYLSKILQSLGDSGIVLGQRGKNGGFTLAHDPAELTMLQVVNAMEPVARIHTCPLGLEGHGSRLCSLHKQLDDIAAHIESTLGGITIADLLAASRKSHPLCSLSPTSRSAKKGVASKKAAGKAARKKSSG